MKVGDRVIWNLGSARKPHFVRGTLTEIRVDTYNVRLDPGQHDESGKGLAEFSMANMGWTAYLSELAPETPNVPVEVDAKEPADLALIGAGKGWKVAYSRLEQLIERGLVTCTGATLTKKGAERAKDG